VWQESLRPDNQAVLARVADLPGPVSVAYEAGPTGLGLTRALTTAGSGLWSRLRRSCNVQW